MSYHNKNTKFMKKLPYLLKFGTELNGIFTCNSNAGYLITASNMNKWTHSSLRYHSCISCFFFNQGGYRNAIFKVQWRGNLYFLPETLKVQDMFTPNKHCSVFLSYVVRNLGHWMICSDAHFSCLAKFEEQIVKKY